MAPARFSPSLIRQLKTHIGSKIMKCNVGGVDRTARLVVGVVLLVVGATVPMATGWQALVFVIAAIALVTGIVRFCPVNAALGLNSCKQHSESGGTRP